MFILKTGNMCVTYIFLNTSKAKYSLNSDNICFALAFHHYDRNCLDCLALQTNVIFSVQMIDK